MKRTAFALLLTVSATVSAIGLAPVQAQPSATAHSSGTTLTKQMPRVVKSGSFMALEHPTQGTARIVMSNARTLLELGSNFRSDSGPDLKVVLHRAAKPGMKLMEGDYIILGSLQKTSGSQSYMIPSNVNLAQYRSVAIWCHQFNATFGAATLN